MARYVPDIDTKRWVIIASGRIARPDDAKGDYVCPFCQGNEHLTPPEISRIGEGMANEPGWYVRVIPNKYPIVDVHEVIIHSPSDTASIPDFSELHMGYLMHTYRDRFNAHREQGNVLIFSNYGERAGASLKHPHSQVVVVPHQIELDILHRESTSNVIIENDHYTVYCPDFSQWPYEIWIAPKAADKTFGDSSDEELNALGLLLQDMIRKLIKLFPDLHYNYYIHHDKNWYLRIIPRLIHRAGFELGTGLSVNIQDPADVAEQLRKM